MTMSPDPYQTGIPVTNSPEEARLRHLLQSNPNDQVAWIALARVCDRGRGRKMPVSLCHGYYFSRDPARWDEAASRHMLLFLAKYGDASIDAIPGCLTITLPALEGVAR